MPRPFRPYPQDSICAEDAQAGTCSKDATLFTGDSVTGFARDCTQPPHCPPPTSPQLYWSPGADARSGPSGEAPTGTMALFERLVGRPVGFEHDTDVTCLAVSGDTAIVGVAGIVRVVGLGITTWVAGHVRVTDGGGAGSGQDSVELDLTAGPFPPNPPTPPEPGPTDCSTFHGGGSAFSNEEGDLVVTDVDPQPTSQDH